MYEVCVLLGAEREMQEAYNHLEAHDPEQAEHVEGMARRALASLETYPYLAPVKLPPYRRLVLGRTPYGFFYVVTGTRVLVHAFLDLRQDPDAIRRRLGL